MVKIIKRATLTALLFFPAIVFAQSQPNYSVGETQFCSLEGDGGVNCIFPRGFERLTPPDNLPAFSAVTTGDAHACGLTPEGEAICWGASNFFGQLDVPSVELPFVQINAGQNHTCAVDSLGTATCWGLNSNLQTEPPEGELFTQVDAGFTSSCGILINGDITCWSSDFSRALERLEGPFVALDMEDVGVCGLLADGNIRCSTRGNTALSQNGPYSDIAVTEEALCALDSSGLLDCAISAASENDYPVGEPFLSIQSVDTAFSGIVSPNPGVGTTMCGERLDGSFQCWAEARNFPDLSNPIPAQIDLISQTRLDLDARVYGVNTVEIFWNPITVRSGPTPQVEIFRNGESIDIVNARFSYLDLGAVADSTYQIRLVDAQGNTGPLSGTLSVDTVSDTVLFNGELPFTPTDRVEEEFDQEIITDVNFVGVFGGFIVSWEVDPELVSTVDRFEILIGGGSVGFTRSQLYVETDMDLGGRCLDVVAVDAAGTALDSATARVRGCN